ncbi:putative nuclease HARBI1 [Boleophthalmus pectinirostris]|uniref:putative nuclease HARBI1 n=1 Tax=Boleophthalmus pectinirostris TaxID=150288 RepID=UPI000A1C2EC2|nr:putative nuclease HARBI1 [Boleophthalmus pectinirostris]XP_055020716.1 putative nuclease HARBI1 [Boleophthalmus pectinirostris]
MAISIAILDCDLLLHGRGQKTMDRFDLDSVSDHFLITHFGFPKSFILYLVELLRESLSRRTQRSRAISPEVQVMAALGFYTSGSYQTSMGDTIGISQASMSRCVSNVTKALVEKAPQFISFFRDESSKEQMGMFERVAGFPGVIGVLDFVQVAIKAPNSEDQSYVNKKGFHSVGVQLVCDSRGLLLSAETHWPGALRDFDVLQRSALYKTMEDLGQGWLLGDSRYPLRKWLMTPVDYPESPADFRYNLSHTTTHEIVDRTFRAIQTRFKCLDSSKGYLQYSPDRSSSIILACCVLHNASLQSGLDAWTLERTDPREPPERVQENPEDRDHGAYDIRKDIILKHFS